MRVPLPFSVGGCSSGPASGVRQPATPYGEKGPGEGSPGAGTKLTASRPRECPADAPNFSTAHLIPEKKKENDLRPFAMKSVCRLRLLTTVIK